MATCAQCRTNFEHHPVDAEFLQRYDLPLPEDCPACRHRQRCAYRNERTLYKRKCDLCGTTMVTIFAEGCPFPVYCSDCWWSDKWDALSYGREFDFSRPFFEQFAELQSVVPRLALNNIRHENSEYCNQCTGNRNCYLLFAADDNEDSLYSYWINRCRNVLNSSYLADSEWCADLIDSENCHRCTASQDLKNCRDCLFSFDLIGCSDCCGCAGLRNKKYHIFNQPFSEKEYREKIASFELGKRTSYQKFKQEFFRIRQNAPHKYAHILQSENAVGDYISHSRNCFLCFNVFDAEDCRYSYNLVHRHFRNMDVSYVTETRDTCQAMSSIGQDLLGVMTVWYCSNVAYSDLAMHCHDIFGTVGLRHEQHCIFNKVYSPKAYQELRQKIIEHMKKTGEWGKFFPIAKSFFAYNETVAQDFFPLTREEVQKRGWRWKEKDRREYRKQSYRIPDDIRAVPEKIIKEILACEECGKNYQILEPELRAYKDLNTPVPWKCPDCRYLERMALRNPQVLWKRNCMNCGAEVETSYAPERPEKIYCEKCYLEATI